MLKNPESRDVTVSALPTRTAPSVHAAGQAKESPTSRAQVPVYEGAVRDWTLDGLLGQGGMSVVYRAEHQWLRTKAAIKFLHPNVGDSGFAKARERFYLEAYILSQFQHPNIVSIQDFGVDPEFGAFMVLDLLEGMELTDLIGHAPLPLSWVLEIFVQISDALHVLHERHYIHRDLKPSNVFLSLEDEVLTARLLDFGVAKTIDDGEYKKLTTTGRIVGTPKYIAPEQLRTPELVSPLTDLYSLGAMLYEALTGTTPHAHPDIVEYLLMVTQKSAPPLGVHRPEFSGTGLEEMLARMLSIDPLSRPLSAREFQEEFRACVLACQDPLASPEIEHKLRGVLRPSEPREELPPTPPREIAMWPTRGEGAFLPSSSSGVYPAPLPHGNDKGIKSRGFLIFSLALCSLLAVVGLTWLVVPPTPKEQGAKRARSAAKSPVNNWAIKGQQAFQRKDYSGAIHAWKRVLTHEGWPKSQYHPKLYWALGVAHLRVANKPGALKMFLAYQAGVTKAQQALAVLRRHTSETRLIRRLREKLPDPREFQQQKERIAALQKTRPTPQRENPKEGAQLQVLFQQARKALGSGRIKLAKARLRTLVAKSRRGPRSLVSQNLAAQAARWMRELDAMHKLYKGLPHLLKHARFREFQAQSRALESKRQGLPLPQAWQRNLLTWSRANQRGARQFSRANNAYALSQWHAALRLYRLFLKRFPHAAQVAFLRKRLKACRCVVKKLPWEACKNTDYPKHYTGKRR